MLRGRVMAIPLGKHRDTKGPDVRPLRDAAESDRGVWLQGALLPTVAVTV